jgi:hypothetical protein
MRILKACVAAAFLLLGLRTASADTVPSPCTLSSFDVQVVTYWWANSLYDHTNERCDNPGDCRLQGWVISKKGWTTPHKAVLWAHGSDGGQDVDQHSLDTWCGVFYRLVNNGYVVYFPLRRGVYDTTTAMVAGTPHYASTSGVVVQRTPPGTRFAGDPGGYFTNTGWPAGYWSDLMAAGDSDVNVRDGWYIDYLQDEIAIDMNDALNKLVDIRSQTGYPIVDRNHITFAGHSIGGAAATIASGDTYDVQPVAFASLSGAVLSWHESYWWPSVMVDSATGHRRVIYFDRLLNEDPSTPQQFDSAYYPYEAAVGHDGGALIAEYPGIYPSNCSTPYYWCVHGAFRSLEAYIPIWFPDFLQFLNNHG